ncbi:MAG: hypothetical protein GWN99_16335 [Gemmatimonadetes bacterium]|uniref:Uncharacterized protein n=1 Tax=Candidatus Kutchimonas denitrificans TaxID=3056748 RepID=A0AAE5CA99_9BACT|nr:hypothetical protein [Gemmatimonadota bacterium]NIR74357.1 hypothetical protein [Candidatus Kutchimonas denitrificans]NIS02608.1 hypothetical protein [Gemmatimonadota bacterium]NIT68483.1 hypothetical protein [Gemmatimonadota bacterium]NIU51960.1 hypothetical protein [Gemmatimonadota bacterium]
MAVTRTLFQLAHIVIVVAYTLFCVAVLGIEHPIVRLVASIASALPVLWAVWVVALARVPAETIRERVKEATRFDTGGHAYRQATDELVALTRDTGELLRLSDEVRDGRMSPDSGFRRRSEIDRQMKRRVERINELTRP